MPNHKTHCAISKKRTGFDFSELHKWIDENQKEDGINHRRKRHYYNETDKKSIKEHWNKEKDNRGKPLGEKALVEWLFHIAIDNLETAYKFSSKKFSYGVKTYNYIEICFHKSRDGDIGLNFKHLPESKLPY